MRKVWWMCLVVSLAATACGDDGRGDGDGDGDASTGSDTITIPDTDFPDAVEDTMPDTNDPPPPPEGCAANADGTLTNDCYPRCAIETASVFMPGGCPMDDPATPANEQADCVQAAVSADTTPPTSVTVPGGAPLSLDCEGCVNFAQQLCLSQACPTEFQAFATCLQTCQAGGGDEMACQAMCQTEIMAINACVMTPAAQMTAQTCANVELLKCFQAPM